MPNRKTIIFDLDETLVHTSPNPQADRNIFMNIKVGNKQASHRVAFRPYAREILA